MGLFDKLKGVAENTASNFKKNYDEAMLLSADQLCNEMTDMSKLDGKYMPYSAALSEKCTAMENDQLEEFYQYVKKQGSLFKKHPAQETVENVLVDKKLYVRKDDGSVVKNSAAKWFK